MNFAQRNRLTTMLAVKEYVDAGDLMSYGPSIPDMYRRSATYVDKILKGAKAGELPVEQPTKFQLVISLKTAKAIGLTIPQTLLAGARRFARAGWNTHRTARPAPSRPVARRPPLLGKAGQSS